MKKNTPVTRMAFIAIIALLFSITIANAQPYWSPTEECKPKPPATTTIPAAPTATVIPAPTANSEMVPYLVSFNAAGAVVKKERLASAISSTDTFYYDQKGNQIKKKDVVQWFPKYNNDLEKVIAGMKAMDVRSWFGTIYGWDYTKHESDSLAKRVVREINGKFDSRPLIASIYENSPHFRRLKALEATDLELRGLISALETRINNLPTPDMSGFVTSGYFNEFENRNIELWCMQDTMNALLNTGLAAVDEQLSTTRGKRWEQMKVKHGVVQYFDFVQTLTVPKPVTEQISLSALPTTEQQPAKEKSKRGAMPRPHRH